HHIELPLSEELSQSPSRAPYRMWTADANRTERIDGRSPGREFATQTAVEAHRKMRLHAGAEFAVPGQRHEHRLDTAIQVPAMDVKNLHRAAAVCCRTVSGGDG